MLFPNQYSSPERVIFEKNGVFKTAVLTRPYGDRGVYLLSSSFSKSKIGSELISRFSNPTTLILIAPSGEPTITSVELLIKQVIPFSPHFLCAIGGGSVLDLGKAVAGLLKEKSVTECHNGAPILHDTLPFFAIPTTAGTGSEVTPNSVLTNKETLKKASIRHSSWIAKGVILDPTLLLDVPPSVIANSGMDALTQATEAYLSKNSTDFTDNLALCSIRSLLVHLPLLHDYSKRGKISVDEGTEKQSTVMESAEHVLLGSFYAGIALTHARLGVIHGLAHPLGAIYDLPHGMICANLLPLSLKLHQSRRVPKLAKLEESLNLSLVEKVTNLNASLSIKNEFENFSLKGQDKITKETLSSGSTAASPISITEADVLWFLENLLFKK